MGTLKRFLWSLLAVVAGGMLFHSENLYGQYRIAPINGVIYKFEDVHSVVAKVGGRYIPADLEDAIKELDKELDAKQKKLLRDSAQFVDLHFGMGMWIRNNWGLWGHSRLQKYFLKHGVWHADDMSSIIIDEYLNYLQGKPYETKLEEDPVAKPKYENYNFNDAFIDNLSKNRKEMLEAGFGANRKVRFTFPYGYSSMEEANAYKDSTNVKAPEGFIRDVDYLNKRILVEVKQSYLPQGVIIYDGNLKEMPGKVYVKRNLEEGSEDMESIVFMKKGERIWFPLKAGHWEGVGKIH